MSQSLSRQLTYYCLWLSICLCVCPPLDHTFHPDPGSFGDGVRVTVMLRTFSGILHVHCGHYASQEREGAALGGQGRFVLQE